MAKTQQKKNRIIDYNTKILEVKNLKKHFTVGVGRSKLIVPAVDDVTFDIYKREVFGLVGESGCGKTTTGRTIIKLYEPTSGSVKLNGLQIGAGTQEHLDRIKEIKAKLKLDIIKYDPRALKAYEINQERDHKIADLKHQEQLLQEQYLKDKAQIELPFDTYKNEKFKRNELHKFDVESAKYDFILESDKIKQQRINQVEKLYKDEIAIEKKKYKNKLEGLKESAALVKEDKLQRIAELKVEYAENLKALDNHFLPLIEEGKNDIISKEEAKAKIHELKEIRNKQIHDLKVAHEEDMAKLEVPCQEQFKKDLADLKAKLQESKAKIKAEILKTKLEAKEAIAKLPRHEEDPETKAKNQEEIKILKEKAREEIKVEKEKIANAKRINNSKEALLMSQKMQMIFQDPISSLNPRMTVKEIIGEGLIIQGELSDDEITEKVKEALELVGLSRDHAMRYPHEFSGGQRQRIGVARALIMQPNFIIADEPISALDVSIQAQVINLLQELKNKLDLTILFIAHDLSVVRFFCDRIAVMFNGKIMEMASSEELFKHPMHPYTKSLLSAIPVPDPDYEKDRKRIHYNPRMHDYRFDKPFLQEIAPGHQVFCNKKEFEEMKKEYKKQEKEAK